MKVENLSAVKIIGVYDPVKLQMDAVFGWPIFQSGDNYPRVAVNIKREERIRNLGPNPDDCIDEFKLIEKPSSMIPYQDNKEYCIGDAMPHAFIINKSEVIVGSMREVARQLEQRLDEFSGPDLKYSKNEILGFIEKSK